MITKKETVFGKSQIKSIAKQYGFWIEFSAPDADWPIMNFGRMDDDENEAYFSGGPNNADVYTKMSEPERNAYLNKYNLTCAEIDPFETDEITRYYFSSLRDQFLETYPEFKNHNPVDHYGKEKKKKSLLQKSGIVGIGYKTKARNYRESHLEKKNYLSPESSSPVSLYHKNK